MATGKEHGNWKGGYFRSDLGYWKVYMPEHPRASKGHVFEHIIIAEKTLGKPLPKEVVIHHSGDKDDNSQIVICQDETYHNCYIGA